MRPMYGKRAGFTVVELMVAIGIISLITIGLLALIINLVGTASQSIETSKQVNEVQTALGTVGNDLALTSRFLATTTGDVSPSNAAWKHNSGTAGDRTLLLQVRSTTPSSTAESRLPLYRMSYPAANLSDICLTTSASSTILGLPLTGEPEHHTIIYYLHEQTLYRRIIVQPHMGGIAPECATNTPVRTCDNPTSSTKPANCLERDIVLAQNVTHFDIVYYSQPGDQTANTSAYTSSTPQDELDNIQTIKVTIRTLKDVNGKNNEFTSQIRANRNAGL